MLGRLVELAGGQYAWGRKRRQWREIRPGWSQTSRPRSHGPFISRVLPANHPAYLGSPRASCHAHGYTELIYLIVLNSPILTSVRELRPREGSSLQGQAWDQDPEQSPTLSHRRPPPCWGAVPRVSLGPAPECQVHPRPAVVGGGDGGAASQPTPRAAFPPISAEPAGPYKTAVPDKSTIGTCFARRPAVGLGGGRWEAGGGRWQHRGPAISSPAHPLPHDPL